MLATLLRAALALALLAVAAPAAADDADGYDRLYLAADAGGYQHWTVDPSDPELDAPNARYECRAGSVGGRRCLSSSTSRFYTTFGPAAILDERIHWTPEQPVRFHIEAEVETPAGYTVHAGLQQGAQLIVSEAATEVAPGVWEGEIGGSGTWDPGNGNRLYLYVRGPDPRVPVTVDIALAGRSWFELPTPVPGRSVPQLLQESPDAAEPMTHASRDRQLWFNDADWSWTTFTGDLDDERRFPIRLARPAQAIIAWVEGADAPFVHHAVRSGSVDPARLLDTPIMSLQRNGAEIAAGAVQHNQRGRGSNALATGRVPAGEVVLHVSPYDEETTQGTEYTAHVVVLHGDRTLQRMRWSYEPAIAEPFIPARAGGAGTCVNRTEPVPATAALRTFAIDLSWDTVGAPTADYTFAYSYPNGVTASCAEHADGKRLRVTVPGERVWLFSATPASGATFAGYRDTVFTMDARFSYAPAP